jgi:hypothetical protein
MTMRRPGIATLLALVSVVAHPRRAEGNSPSIDEVIHPWAVSIVETPTPPSGPRRIDVNRWEDLLRASELLGRPILRLRGGEGGAEGTLFYVADGPQSYVFGFTEDAVNVGRSGAYASIAPPVPMPRPSRTPEPTPRLPLSPQIAEDPRPPVAVPSPVPASSPELDPADAWLGPAIPERETDVELPSATVVERRIREMIHELLADFRELPPSSDRLERGMEHVQRAIDMLHLGRYGVAQIELNKAARLLREPPEH